jgi:exonuclease SbcD
MRLTAHPLAAFQGFCPSRAASSQEMRLLHTADWHLGRCFHGESLLPAQQRVIDFTVETARSADLDAILLAGDVYDRALPPVAAVRQASEALERLSEIAPVVVISGNHDSAVRLGFGAALLERAGVHLRTAPARCGEPIALEGMCLYALPYLEPDVARADLECEGRGHAAVLEAAMAHVRRDLATRPAGTLSVVVAHAFVAGASASDSERDLSVGGASAVPPGTFAGIDYLALGHIHRPQVVGENGRYAGSPLAFSFSEARDHKSLAIIELSREGHEVELVPVPAPRPLACVRGTLDELLADPALRECEGSWIQATLTDPVRPEDAMERLRRRFPHTAELRFDPAGGVEQASGSYVQRLHGLGALELAEQFVRDVRGCPADELEEDLLANALSAQRLREAAA